MLRFVRFTVAGFLALVFLACQEAGPLLPALDSAAATPRVLTIAQGSLVKPGDAIPLALAPTADNMAKPDAMTVRLYALADTENTKILAEYIPSAAQLDSNAIPSFTLPKLVSGAYRLAYRLSRNGVFLKEESVIIFYNPEILLINNVFVYPGTVVPGGDGLLDLAATIPAGTKAWVRWSLGNEVLKTGLVENGRDRLRFTAKAQEGVYTYTVEVFPAQAPDGLPFTFRSPYAHDTQVVVSNKKTDAARLLDSTYLHHWSMAGTLDDSGRHDLPTDTIDFKATGERVLDISGEVLGYNLGSGHQLEADAALLGDLSREFLPSAFYMRFLPLDGGSSVLLSSRDSGTGSGFQLKVLAEGGVQAHFWGKSYDYTLSAPTVVSKGTPIELCLAVVRRDGKIQVLMEVNGALSASGAFDLPVSNLPVSKVLATGKTVLGGETPGHVLFAELAIFQIPDQPGINAFYVAMARRYGTALRFAHDFSAEKLLDGFVPVGDIRFSQGNLIMAAGSALQIPAFTLGKQAFQFEFSFAKISRDKNTTLTIESPGMKALVIGFDGTIHQGERYVTIPVMTINPLIASLVVSSEGLRLQSSEISFLVADYQSGQALTMHLDQTGSKVADLALVSLVGRETNLSSLNLEP